MTNLEKLNEENSDMSLENLTEEEASAAIKFSPELAGGKKERTEYLRNIDINTVKSTIAEPNFDLLDEKETLMNNYGFTEEEIEEGVAHLEEVRANPDMLEYDIENAFPRLIVIAIAACLGTGSAVSQCTREQKKQEELKDRLDELQAENRKQERKEDRQEEREERREERKEKREERKEERKENREERKENREERREERKEKREERKENREERKNNRQQGRRRNNSYTAHRR